MRAKLEALAIQVAEGTITALDLATQLVILSTPRVTKDSTNKNGAPLSQCLTSVAKFCLAKQPGWEIHSSLQKQARDFQCRVDDLYEVIHSVPRLNTLYEELDQEYVHWRKFCG